MSDRPAAPEQRTIDVDVEALDTRGRTLTGYAAVYGVESSDLGGFTERIAAGAFAGVMDADVRALLNHDPSQVLGRTKSGTLRLTDEQRGLRFECDLPDSPLGQNVREAVRRGDVDGASFRFKVGEEDWDGDMRTVKSVAELHDVTVATYGAYPDASVELRTRPQKDNAADNAEKDTTMDNETRTTDELSAEDRAAPNTGGLQVEDRINSARPRGLAEEFRAAGFPGESATLDFAKFAESRAVTWTGSVDNINAVQASAGPFGADQRFAWPAFGQVSVDAGATSVDVATQTARSLATPANVVRAIDAITAKPETGSTLTIVTTALKQVASIYSNVPNIHLEQPAFNTVIETDLRLAINGGLDKLILDAIATSGFQAPGTDPLLVSIRKAITTIQGSGYSPDVLLLTPANAEALDTLRATATAGEQYYVFAPAQLAPRNIFGLSVRISKDIPAPAVVDSTALGKLYTSPVTLARFEADGGTTNRQNIRMELNSVFGVERTAAAVRIAAA
jgi:HK97 family phage prohead protease